MRNTKTRGLGTGMLVVALALVGCGGDDDDGATTGAEDDGDESVDVGDIPDQCRELMGDFLARIEPIVEDVDWENASIEDFESIGDEFEQAASEMEEEVGDDLDECDDLDIAVGTPESLAMMTEIAEDRAPGVLAFLAWQQGLMEDLEELSDITLPDITIPDITLPDISIPDITLPDISLPDISLPALPAGTPETCEDAIAYVEDVIAEHDSMMSMPIEELTAFSNAQLVISSECSLQDMSEFFNRSDIQDFLSG